MVINRTAIGPKTMFKDLKLGEVFYFLNRECDKDKIKIYMRCGSSECDRHAVNLETGTYYSFHDNEPVQILKADMNVKI